MDQMSFWAKTGVVAVFRKSHDEEDLEDYLFPVNYGI